MGDRRSRHVWRRLSEESLLSCGWDPGLSCLGMALVPHLWKAVVRKPRGKCTLQRGEEGQGQGLCLGSQGNARACTFTSRTQGDCAIGVVYWLCPVCLEGGRITAHSC